MTDETNDRPKGELTLRTLAMPGDTNAAGDIFGGWVMSQMDLASGIRGAEVAGGRIVTVAVNEMDFRMPVKVGDMGLAELGGAPASPHVTIRHQRKATPTRTSLRIP